MARVNKITRSNKEHTCGHVPTHVIPKGDPYLWAKPGFRTRTPKIRCVDHPFRPSELATGLNAEPMAAQEEFDDTLGTLYRGDYDGLEAAVDAFREALEAYRDARQEALDAWENGNSQFEQYVEEAEEALGYLEDLTIDPFEEEEPEDADSEEWAEWDAQTEDHWDEQITNAEDASASVSL